MRKDLETHIIHHFEIEDGNISFETIAHGYINKTYLVLINSNPKYVLQRINKNVFKNAEQIQHNIDRVLNVLKGSNYSEIKFLTTLENKTLLNHEGHYWRLMTYIKDSQVHNTAQDPEIAFQAGKLIGTFHDLVKNEDLNAYHETLPNFHNIEFRAHQFKNALNETQDHLKRKSQSQIKFAQKTLPIFDPFYKSDLPYRLCHNDTKLNNILFNSNNKALCLIDLDTIMKGHFHYDFGDVVKTTINQASENEIDVSKVTFEIHLFKHFVEGLKMSQLKLSDQEIELLPLSVVLMSFIHGIRALTDYLSGNIYYKVTYPEQNLNRARILFQFTQKALDNLSVMKDIVHVLK